MNSGDNCDLVEKAKRELPAVTVFVDGREVRGLVRPSSKRDWIAKVLIDLNGERQVLEFTWSAIVRAAYEGEVLLA